MTDAEERPTTNTPRRFAEAALRAAASPTASWLVVVLYAALIFHVSSLPLRRAPSAMRLFPHADKVIHAIEFALLCFLVCRALTLRRDGPEARERPAMRWIPWLALSLTAWYAATDEFHQAFVPLRKPDAADFAADVTAAALVAALWPWLVGKWPWTAWRPPAHE